MPLPERSGARRRRKTPEKQQQLPERPGESSTAQVMAPTRMKLRVRRRDNAAAGAAADGVQPEQEEERSRERGGRSSKRKNAAAAAAATAVPTTPASPPPSSSTASARAVMAAEEASPDSKCPICLDRFNNLAYLDRCLHRFCFPCIQEWSHNKAECPLCKQPFASILHSVRAEDDFKEYTLRPAPANSSVAATVAMVAAMASAARSDHQMRLMLRRHRGADGGETMTRRRRRERGGRGPGSGVWEWYLDSPPLEHPPLPHHPAVSPVVAEDSEEGEDLEEQRMRGGADLAERGVIFEGLTGLGGGVAPVAPNDRASRRLMTRLVARQRLQREGGTVRGLREREMVAFRRALYRSGIRVRGVAGINGNQVHQRDITADSFRRNPTHLNRLRPWLRRELTVLYGAHGSLVDIVQRIIMARLARHGLEDTPTIEEELRPFLLARTDHFLHELVSFARSPLSLENYDLQAVYEPPTAALDLDGMSSSSDSSSVIAISEGDEEERRAGGRSDERAGSAHDDVIQAGSCLSLSVWDDETPGPSYSTAEPSCSLASPPLSPASQEAANEGGERREDECLIVGYKKPMAERTPELVQLSSDTEDEEEKKKKDTAETLLTLPTAAPPFSYLPTIPPSTSGAFREEQDGVPKEKGGEEGARARSWSGSSGRSRNSVCTLSPAPPGEGEPRHGREGGGERKSDSEGAREKRKKKRRRRGRERSGTLYNPNRSIYPAMMRHRSPSPFHSSVESGSPPSPPDSSWEFHCAQVSPLTSSASSAPCSSSSSSSSSSPLCSSLQPPAPSLSPGNNPHGEKPGGKRKYKSRHLDSNDKDPTWRPSSGHSRERRKDTERKRRRRGRDGRRRRERQRRDGEESRSRGDRSPSVEIIYEGTVDAAESPACKRRRKQHRRTQHSSSSPVIITLDSDSSHDDANAKNVSSSGSSPLSSQQTVDFSDLPPLPLVPSAGAGGALNAEIGELPVDILDRGSDGSEAEATGPIAIDNSDDDDVDVENVEESISVPGSDDDRGPMRAGATKSSPEVGGAVGDAAPNLLRKRNSEFLASDSRLLESILNDLQGLAAPKCKPVTTESGCRKRRLRDQREDGWSTETRDPGPDSPNRTLHHNQGLDSPTCRTSARPPPPPLEPLKERRVRVEGKDAPPLLKQASPVRAHNRNTPPPLKHKDAGSPHLHSPPPSGPAGVNSHVDLSSNPSVSPVDALWDEDAEAVPPPLATDTHSSPRSATVDSRSAAPSKNGALTVGVHSPSHQPHIDPRSSSPSGSDRSPTGADGFSRLELNSRRSSGRDATNEVASSALRSSPLDLHLASPLSSVDFHLAKAGCPKKQPAHADSTSRGGRSKTGSPNPRLVAPPDLHPSSGVAAEGTPASADGVFSGGNGNDTSPPALVLPVSSRTQDPPPHADAHSSSTRASVSERRSAPGGASVPSGRRRFPVDARPGSPERTVERRSSGAGLADIKASSLLNHADGSPHLPPVELHRSSPAPPAPPNHAALPSATFQTSQTKCGSYADPAVDSHSRLNHFDPRPGARFPADGPVFRSPPRSGEDPWSASAEARSDPVAR